MELTIVPAFLAVFFLALTVGMAIQTVAKPYEVVIVFIALGTGILFTGVYFPTQFLQVVAAFLTSTSYYFAFLAWKNVRRTKQESLS